MTSFIHKNITYQDLRENLTRLALNIVIKWIAKRDNSYKGETLHLIVKIFNIDDELVGGLLRGTESHKTDGTHELLHSETIQFQALEFFTSIVVGYVKREPQGLCLKQIYDKY